MLWLLGAAGALAATPPHVPTATHTAQAGTVAAARVEFFSPTGDATSVRQALARFSVPMVALGDPRLPDPFTVNCGEGIAGHGRWADPRNWVYDFDEDLEGGVNCAFDARPGLRSVAGAALQGKQSFHFSTGGPTVVGELPEDGTEAIDEDQIFLVKFDARPDEASLGAHAFCAVEGLAERIPAHVLSGAERANVLAQRSRIGYEYWTLIFKSGAVADVRVRQRNLERNEARVAVLRCARTLAPGAKVQLVMPAGIRTASGIATREDQRLAYRVRESFVAQVECTRVNPKAGCMPALPIEVNFTSPVPQQLALAIRLKLADGRTLAPHPKPVEGGAAPASASKGVAPVLEGVAFDPPFAAQSSVTVLLPPGFVDDAGRTLENAQRFPLAVRVDEFPPLVKFPGTFGILEAAEGGVLPVTLRAVEASPAANGLGFSGQWLRTQDPTQIVRWLNAVERQGEPSGEWVDAPPAATQPREKLADHDPEAADETSPTRVWRETTGHESVFGIAGTGDRDQLASTSGGTPQTFTLPVEEGGKPLQVVGVPLKTPGFYVVEIASPRLGSALLGEGQTRYVSTAVLVTDLTVHFLWGREGSRVWVTRLRDASPVAGADVTVRDACNGRVHWSGRSDASGLATIGAALPQPVQFDSCIGGRHPLLVSATLDADTSFALSSWSRGIAPEDFSLPIGSVREARLATTVLDRSLFRAGETVSMKHFLRTHVMQGLVVPATVAGRHKVLIAHNESDQHYALEAVFDANGQATSQWKIPAEAALGTYSVSVDGHETAHFKVEQFRLPTMRASVSGSPTPLVQPKRIDLDLHVAYLAGGSAGGLPVKLRTLVEPEPLHFQGYGEYEFGGDPVQEGISDSAGRTGDIDAEDSDEDTEAPAADAQQTQARARTQSLALDADGAARVHVEAPPTLTQPARMHAELEYADANGETLTSAGSVVLVPSSIALGIRTEGWAGSAEQLRVRVVALDLNGHPVAGQPVSLTPYQSQTYSYRKRLIGGFYAYETVTETHKLTTGCEGKTNAQGLLLCELSPGVTGELKLRAQTRDANGNVAGATTSAWLYGADEWWFGGTSGDRMDVVPEKQEYESGERARLQVRSPFRDATALVTVQREGVLTSFVTHLSGHQPIIEVPIEAAYAPNVFVSVLAVRGRLPHATVDGAKVTPAQELTALVDLNKPAFRLGMAKIRVGWKPHRLEVAVRPSKPTWHVRDRADLTVHVTAADGHALPAGTEVAIAAVDEALLDLSPNETWDLLGSMMGERGLEVLTSSGQTQVIGKRHYGRKAVPHGGGGGRELGRAREQFDSLLLWDPKVTLDANGDAHLSVPLNDSLSSFRIVAIASGGAEKFGMGYATVNTTQDLIALSGLPPLVREGDRFAATFTVRNTSAQPASVHVQATVKGVHDALPPRTLQIPPGQARDVAWPLTVPVGLEALDWDLTVEPAAAGSGPARGDRLHVRQQVIEAVPVRTYQATIAQLVTPLAMPVQRPREAIAGRGGLDVTVQSTLAGGLDGVREYAQRYPYDCLEQQASVAVALDDRARWDALMRRLPAYLDRDGLLRYFPTSFLEGDDTLTSYVLSIASEAGWEIDDTDQRQMIDALKRFVSGRLVRYSSLQTADLAVRKLAALAALARYDSVDARLLTNVSVDVHQLPTSGVLDWIDVLARTPSLKGREAKLGEAYAVLRARLNFQGTIMRFGTERTDALWWLMISGDSNANRLLLAILARPDWREDVPRVVRGALERQRHGHWNTTVANAWGALAMREFSEAFEKVPVAGTTVIRYQQQQQSIHWPLAEQEAHVSLPWQEGPGGIAVAHSGGGAPWAMLRATAALPLTEALSSGLTVHRTVQPVVQAVAGQWSKGDVARVHLDLESAADITWLVVEDPVPAGSTVLGAGLGGQSALLQRDARARGAAWLAFEEHRFDGYRAYYQFVPKGRWSVEYTVRLNNPGTFVLPATRVESMYAPETFAEAPNAPVTIQPGR